jgi:hypothetical protein
MNRTRWRLVVACLAVIAAAIAVAGGSAGNRTAATPFKFLPGDSFTYGEQFATETKIMNSGSSMFTQLEVHHLIPVTAGANPVPVALLGSSCGAVVVGNEAVCKFDQLSSKSTLTATFLWQAPTSGVAVTTNGYWSIKEGKDTNLNERFDFEGGPFSASLLGNDPTTERKRAGGYETPGAVTCIAGSGNLQTNPALSKDDPVSSTLCLPAGFTIPPGFALGYSAMISEIADKPSSGSHTELGQSVICVAVLGQACGPTHTPADWGTTNEARHIFRILQDAMKGPKQIVDVFHNGVKLPLCSANAAFAQGCVVEIIPPPAGVSPEVWTVVANAPTNGPWNW